MSEPATESAQPSVPVILLQQAIGALQTTSVAVAEVKAEVVASRDASARAHETHGRRLDDFSGVVASVAAAQAASTAVNARLATALEKWEARTEATAAKVSDAATDAALASKKADEDRINARKALLAQVDFWITRIVVAAATAWFAHRELTVPDPGTTTTTATTTITAPADVAH